MLYGYRNDIETMSEEELNKVKEEYRRKKIKFFYRYIYNKVNNNIQKVMFMQKSKPAHILIKMNKNEHEKYNEKYTYNAQVLKDRYKQMVLDNHGNLSKLQQKISFHNTDEDYDKLVSICKKDENFKEMYNKYGSYIDAIYIYDANSLSNKTDPFELIDTDMYQAIDNNAICFKHIDYTLNKEAKTFKDMFEFAEANKSISSNLKANSCFFNLIIATYKEAFENVYCKYERRYQDLTPDRLCEILKIENKDQDLGLSIRTSLKFFEKFHLGLVVVNIYDEVIFKYSPEVKNKFISPQTLYILVYNNHCFRLDSNENSFTKKLNNKEVIEHEKETYNNLKKSLSTRFYFRNFDKEAKKIYIDNLDDVVSHVEDNEEKENINFITNTDLTKMLFQMIDNKYTPYVNFESGILSRLCFKLKSDDDDEKAVLYSIQCGDSSLIYDEIMTVEQNEISNYDKADRKIYEWLLNKNNISQRNEYIRQIENKYQMSPLSGYFDYCNVEDTYNTILINHIHQIF